MLVSIWQGGVLLIFYILYGEAFFRSFCCTIFFSGGSSVALEYRTRLLLEAVIKQD